MDIEGGLTPFEANLLDDMGITENSLREHREEILKIIFKDGRDTSSFEFDRKKIATMITRWNSSSGEKDRAKVRLVLPGKPTITLSSDSRLPMMLPWKISISTKSENLPKVKLLQVITYSPEIPKLVFKMIGNSVDPMNKFNLEGSRWWQHKMWSTYSH